MEARRRGREEWRAIDIAPEAECLRDDCAGDCGARIAAAANFFRTGRLRGRVAMLSTQARTSSRLQRPGAGCGANSSRAKCADALSADHLRFCAEFEIDHDSLTRIGNWTPVSGRSVGGFDDRCAATLR